MTSPRTSRGFAIAMACSGLLVLASCDGTGHGVADGGTGYCGAGVEAGQACNTLTDPGPAITPTCTTDPLPVGTGGTIEPGTYVFAAQTYHGTSVICPTSPIASSFVLSGSCIQGVDQLIGILLTSSGTFAVHGNQITFTPTCNSGGNSSFVPDAPTKTFTATPNTLTLFTLNSAVGNPNPDRAEVFVKQ
jgi:hypothetical protein